MFVPRQSDTIPLVVLHCYAIVVVGLQYNVFLYNFFVSMLVLRQSDAIPLVVLHYYPIVVLGLQIQCIFI
jgi:hypothetical protein